MFGDVCLDGKTVKKSNDLIVQKVMIAVLVRGRKNMIGKRYKVWALTK